MGGGAGGGDSVGIRRNPDNPTLCLAFVVNQWNLRAGWETEDQRFDTRLETSRYPFIGM